MLGDRPSLLSVGGSSLVAAGVLAVALSGPVTHTNSHSGSHAHRQQRAHLQQHPCDGGTAAAGDGVHVETAALLGAGDDVEGGYGVLAGGDGGGVVWAGERAPVGLRRGQEEVSAGGGGGGGEDSPGSYYTPRSEVDGDEDGDKGDGRQEGAAAANAAHHHPQQSVW